MTTEYSPIILPAIKYLNGFQTARTGNATITVASGACSAGDENQLAIVVSDASTTINCANVGLNGLDTGALAADTDYAVYVIADAAGFKAPSFIVSTNLTGSPYLPTGYNIARRIKYLKTDGSSHFILYLESGSGPIKNNQWGGSIVCYEDKPGNTLVEIDLSDGLPPINTTATISLGISAATANDLAILQPLGTTSSVFVYQITCAITTNKFAYNAYPPIIVTLDDGAPKVQCRIADHLGGSGNVDDIVNIAVCGYYDDLNL